MHNVLFRFICLFVCFLFVFLFVLFCFVLFCYFYFHCYCYYSYIVIRDAPFDYRVAGSIAKKNNLTHYMSGKNLTHLIGKKKKQKTKTKTKNKNKIDLPKSVHRYTGNL